MELLLVTIFIIILFFFRREQSGKIYSYFTYLKKYEEGNKRKIKQ
ncbi:MAG: hypothetical protein ACOCQW_04330 [Halanaerobiaceae bacterium]